MIRSVLTVRWAVWCAAGLLALVLAGCDASQRSSADIVGPYYTHRYAMARDAARTRSLDRASIDVVLDNMRLGLASMADGDYDEAERALLRAYEYLISGGVNDPNRAVASELLYEGVRVWKGEPYEQAMSFYYLSALYMLKGDWENARAAGSNALFALRDFSGAAEPKDMQQIAEVAVAAEKSGRVDDYFESAGNTIESRFALGYLMVGASYVLMGQPEDATRLFGFVRSLRPDLAYLADALEAARYDTLLIVDVGQGPRKVAYGPDQALVRFEPNGRYQAEWKLDAAVDGRGVNHVGRNAVVDLWSLSQEPKWWSVEEMRKARSAMGDLFVMGGLTAAYVGAASDTPEAMYAGLAAVALGALAKGSAKADTRHLELLPRHVFLVPLTLGSGVHDVALNLAGMPMASTTWHDLTPGRPGEPRVYYLRMHEGRGFGMPKWSPRRLYSVGAYDYQPGDRPWIMGGRDLTPPDEALLKAYQAHGVLSGWTLDQLVELYHREGIVFEMGPQGRGVESEAGNDGRWYRHVVDGGAVLNRPRPGSHLYERVTHTEHRPYVPQTEELKAMISPANERSGP